MEIRKTSENIRNTYNNGEKTETVIESVRYDVVDADGNAVGEATVYQSSATVNFSLTGFSGVEAGEAALRGAFGIASEASE